MLGITLVAARQPERSSMTNENSTVYLSEPMICGWQDEYVSLAAARTELTAQVSEMNKKVGEIDTKLTELIQKIRAAVPFNPTLGEWVQEQEFEAQPDNVALTDAILKAFLRFPQAAVVHAAARHHRLPPGLRQQIVNQPPPAPPTINRQQIVQILPSVGYPAQKLNANPNYLYIALKRLLKRELIEEPSPGQFRITPKGRMEAQKR